MLQMNPLEIGDIVARTIMRDHEIFPSYTADLALEGLLYMYDATKNEEYLNHVLKVWDFREKHNSARLDPNILFTCLHFETYLRTGDSRFISTFTDEAAQWKFSVRRDQDGAVCYHINPESKRIFIDMLQGYAVFMARAGYLSNDEMFFEECVKQYETFRNILRNSSTGLWHQLTDLEEAYPETSGTAFFVHHFYKGFHRGWLSRDPFLNVAGTMLMACAGPWLAREPKSMVIG